MEKRAMIALALSFVVFLAFMYIGEKSKVRPLPEAQQAQQTQPRQPVQQAQPPAPAPAQPAASPTAAKPAAAPVRPAKDVVVETPLFRAVFTEAGGRLKSFQLKKYLESLPFTPISHFKLGPVGFELDRYHSPQNSTAQPKELVRPGPGQDFPLGLSWEGKGLAVPGTLSCEASRPGLNLRDGDKETLKFTCVSPDGLTFVKTFTFKGDSYGFDLGVQVTNRTGQTLDGQLDLDLSENFTGEDASRFHFLGFNGSINNKWEEIKSGGLKEPKTFTGKIDWAGLDEGYFLTAMVPQAAPKTLVRLQETPPGPMVASLRTPVESLPAGQAAQFSYALYFGPKDLKDLQPLGLEKTVNFGWFDFLGRPLLYVLKFFERYSLNYGWAIIILTFLIRIVFFYPNHKSYKSMKDMQKLQPKVAKLREKYKDDNETMNKELIALYKTFKVNPLAGCLPMVIQLPVFIALYNVLGYAIELRHASFISTVPFTDIVWLADLSTKDPLLITPIVMGATMFLQQKMTPSPGDPTQAKMMMFLPLIFTFMFLNFASGLVIYWLVNNVLSIVQQHYTNKYLT
ncbi:MAG: membrane protein insertase YidC [Deltaproteobacteria bacterium]|nr:membrane protein insertase YidC [Deltaproteobacteria bacterium]